MADKLDPKTTCLLLLDLQNIHMSMLPAAADYIQTVADTVARARRLGLAIAHCRVAFTQADLDGVPRSSIFYQRLASGQAAGHHHEAASSAFHDAVAPQDGDMVIRKVRIGPFLGAQPQDFDGMLRERGVETLVLAGVATGGAVLSTVVEGNDLDYRMVVLEDGCADADSETHEALMKVFRKRGVVVSCAQLEGLLVS